MTEETWLASIDPEPMIEIMAPRGGKQQRKLILFATASFAKLTRFLPHTSQLLGIETLEKMAEGTHTSQELRATRSNVLAEWRGSSLTGDHAIDDPASVALMLYRAVISGNAAHHAEHATRGIIDMSYYRTEQVRLLRDIFANPFRPVTFDPRWRTSDVVGLARAIYDDKAFERLPILADALMDAGCEDEQIIGHCRGDGPHVRGCWVVDLILGKE